MLLTVIWIQAARPCHTALMETVHQALRSRVCVSVCAVHMGIHASTQHSNPAAFVCLTYKLQNDLSENLLPQQTVHPPQPLPGVHGAACVCCVCECLQPVCVRVSVCVSILDHFLWLWR